MALYSDIVLKFMLLKLSKDKDIQFIVTLMFHQQISRKPLPSDSLQ